MRPGLVFVALFAVLTTMYVLLIDSLGSLSTFILQASLILLVLVIALRFRYTRNRNYWLLFRDEQESNDNEFTRHKKGNSSGEQNKDS